LIFYEKAQLVSQVDCELCDYIESKEQTVNFERYISQFKNEDEVHNLEIQDILDIDYEKLQEIKQKTLEFIDVISNLIEEKSSLGQDTACEESLVGFFSEKLNEMLGNEINLQIFANNIEKVKGISYSHHGVRLYFNK
jgi:hypothetical protein